MLDARSPLFLRFFGTLFARDLAASFHAVRSSGTLPTEAAPLVVFANHPSWWDGELFPWLLATMFAHRRGYVPIEASMLKRYPFFGRLGAFAVAPGYTGAAAFLAIGEAALGRDDGLLLMNAEGRFRDVRERPLQVATGLSHLGKRVPAARFVPLAIETIFWDERRPNMLLRFGDPVAAEALRAGGQAVLADALAATMDALAADAATRDPARFTTLLAGRTKINVFYDGWRRAKAILRGRHFDPAHGAPMDTP